MQIVNIVVSGNLNQKIDLVSLTGLGKRYIYDSSKYPGGYIILSSVKVTIYASGKYIIPGIHNTDEIDIVWKEFVQVVSEYLDNTKFNKPSIKNIVAQDELGYKLNPNILISKLNKNNEECAEYEPEVFPGLIWKTKYGTANIFKSGKIMLMGCTSEDDLNRLLVHIKNKIDKIK